MMKLNRPVKAIFKSLPDGVEVSWISNYSTIQGIGTEIHWNSKRAGKIYNIAKIKDSYKEHQHFMLTNKTHT